MYATTYNIQHQIRRCHEIYVLANLDAQNKAEVTAFRLCIKKRLFRRFADILETDNEKRKQMLQDLYDDLEEDYLTVINHLPIKQ